MCAQRLSAKGVKDFTVVGTVEEPEGGDWGDEVIMFEGPPARGEVVANLAMSWTIVWAPLTIAAIGRALWVNYKVRLLADIAIARHVIDCRSTQ